MRAHQRKARQNAPELAPARFTLGPQAWESGAAELLRLPQPMGLVGEAGLLKRFRQPLTEAWLQAGLNLELLAQPDGGDCTRAAIEALIANAKGRGVKTLLGFGGGRMIDLAKAAAQAAGWRLATAPTSAATSAAGTAVAVINGPEGGFESILDLDKSPELCLADHAALSVAPPRLLGAGLADTLAKWLEWALLEDEPSDPAAQLGWQAAQRGAQRCRDYGALALAGDAEAQEQAWQACLQDSSTASCAGQAPAAAAHSLANALSLQTVGRSLLHGEAVGLGLLWQEALCAREGSAMMEPGSLKALLGSWGLPLALPAGLDLERLLDDALAPQESVHALGLELERARAHAALPLNG